MPTIKERIEELEERIDPIEFLVYDISTDGTITDPSGNIISLEQYNTLRAAKKDGKRSYFITVKQVTL